jgi:hypothetical protein
MSEIIFVVEEAPEGGFTARALGARSAAPRAVGCSLVASLRGFEAPAAPEVSASP